MRQIKTLKFDISRNICLNLGFAIGNLVTNELIRINRNDVSEIILSYINDIRGVQCELIDKDSGAIEKEYFLVNKIRDENGFIALDVKRNGGKHA